MHSWINKLRKTPKVATGRLEAANTGTWHTPEVEKIPKQSEIQRMSYEIIHFLNNDGTVSQAAISETMAHFNRSKHVLALEAPDNPFSIPHTDSTNYYEKLKASVRSNAVLFKYMGNLDDSQVTAIVNYAIGQLANEILTSKEDFLHRIHWELPNFENRVSVQIQRNIHKALAASHGDGFATHMQNFMCGEQELSEVPVCISEQLMKQRVEYLKRCLASEPRDGSAGGQTFYEKLRDHTLMNEHYPPGNMLDSIGETACAKIQGSGRGLYSIDPNKTIAEGIMEYVRSNASDQAWDQVLSKTAHQLADDIIQVVLKSNPVSVEVATLIHGAVRPEEDRQSKGKGR